MADCTEIAACVIGPHFDAVRDVYAAYEPAPGFKLSKLERTRLIVTPEAHDEERHFARCSDDGLVIQMAPEATEQLDHEQLVAMLAHEFGHAADFAYPGDWVLMHPGTEDQHVVWLGGRNDKPVRRWRSVWHDRGYDHVEWTADSIAKAVTGLSIGYSGRCMLQRFGGSPRPAGLR